MKFPDAKLYLDGQEFIGDEKNPQVIDDWPLHPTQDIQTKLSVGACWQGASRLSALNSHSLMVNCLAFYHESCFSSHIPGSENHMKHYFRGFLAGLSVLLHRQEKPEVIRFVYIPQKSK
jgi:hypothetical protein